MRNRAGQLTVISFSGIDGAGKSTQIAALEALLRDRNIPTDTCAFWDNIVALSGLRERASHQAFGGDAGVGTPENPIDRRDKNVTAWYLTIARMFFYFLDALSLQLALSRFRARTSDKNRFIIFDRYLYDELANLPLDNKLVRLYIRALVAVTPKPDVAFVIDADPDAARRRKPEYPLEFLRKNRQAYLELNQLIGTMTILPPGTAEEITREMSASIAGLYSATLARQPEDEESICKTSEPANTNSRGVHPVVS